LPDGKPRGYRNSTAFLSLEFRGSLTGRISMKLYLVARKGEMRGDFWPLEAGQKFTVGRSPENRIVVHDDLCSRQHAEVFPQADGWAVRDLGSRNGTRVNGQLISRPTRLALRDAIQIGSSEFVLADDPAEFLPPDHPTLAELEKERPAHERKPPLSITARLSRSRFLTDSERQLLARPRVAHDLTRLYRIGLAMGAARDLKGLAETVLDGLLENTHADTGAVLTLGANRELALIAYRGKQTYHKVSDFISDMVLREGQGVLAHDISSDRALKQRQSLEEIGAESLICAPIRTNGRVIGLVHLYSTDPARALQEDDLEFTLAVVHQLSLAMIEIEERQQLVAENLRLRENLRVETELVGQSLAIEQIKEQIGRVAPANATVLVRGESGVGKELVARAIHLNSPRRHGPLICLNCAALTETLLESELFGHEKGAFTGATDQKIGKFESAHRGTIFLDEIGEMKPGTQSKLLRVLEGQPFERVGGGKSIQVDVRVVAATNVDLEAAVQEGRFRRDLYFRLQVVELMIPPLRERKEDIPLLARHFLARLTQEVARRITGFSDGAMRKLMLYDWPGNVRELRNVIERAVVLGTGEEIRESDILLSSLTFPAAPTTEYRPLTLDDLEREHIAATLAHTDWNKSQTASILGIERSTLDRKIQRYGLSR
jgi:Nif-specific regulatory protein